MDDEATEIVAHPSPGRPTPKNLLSLPPELLLQISSHLPLGTRLLFDRQTCRSLRSISGNITLTTPHRLSLAELACAREAIRDAVSSTGSGGDSIGHAAPAGKSHLGSTHKHKRSLDASSNDDTILLIKSIQGLLPSQLSPLYLASTGSSDPTSSPDQLSSEQDPTALSLRTILAAGWHGLPSKRLAQMIVVEPLFRDVRTIVKTTQFESGAWEHLYNCYLNRDEPATQAAYRTSLREDVEHRKAEWGGFGYHHRRLRSDDVVRSMPRVPGEVSPDPDSVPEPATGDESANVTGEQEDPSSAADSPLPPLHDASLSRASQLDSSPPPIPLPQKCIARADVGSKNPPMYVKGQGLSAGFDALCFVPTPNQEDRKSGQQEELKPPRPAPALQHVIYCGRMSTKEAVELEATLHWSEITCTCCKQSIFF